MAKQIGDALQPPVWNNNAQREALPVASDGALLGARRLLQEDRLVRVEELVSSVQDQVVGRVLSFTTIQPF